MLPEANPSTNFPRKAAKAQRQKICSTYAFFAPLRLCAGQSAPESGFALVICMLIALIIITIGMSFTYRVKQKLRVAQQMKDRLQADLRTWSAYQQVLYELSTSLFLGSHFPAGSFDENSFLANPATKAMTPAGLGAVEPTRPVINFHGEKVTWDEGVTVTLQDTAGKVPLLGDDPVLLRRLLEYHQVPSDQVNRIIDSLEDWQDADDLKRLNGAESWQYKIMGVNYVPRNYTCQTMDELLLTWGMTREILDLVRPDMVYFSGGVFNYMNASATLIRASFYPNLSFADKILEARSKGILTSQFLTQGLGLGLDEESSPYPGRRVEISVEGRYGGSISRMTVLLNRTATMKAPFQVESWKR